MFSASVLDPFCAVRGQAQRAQLYLTSLCGAAERVSALAKLSCSQAQAEVSCASVQDPTIVSEAGFSREPALKQVLHTKSGRVLQRQ